jgi:elongation factor P
VAEAAPGGKGDTQGAAYKDAILVNGLKVKVPLFIKKGDTVRIDTRSGEYVERVS